MSKPHDSASRSAELDALILRWVDELPGDFTRRVIDRLDPTSDGCLLWTGTTTGSGSGYGSVKLPSALGALDSHGYTRPVFVHRAMWLAIRGPIPVGLVIDHDDPDVGCGNRLCAQPAHLVVGTQRSNVLSGTAPAALNARRTHCVRGHPLVGPDADLVPGDPRRTCRVCNVERQRETAALVKQANRALGITRHRYRALFGTGRLVAECVLWAAETCAAAEVAGHSNT